MKCKRCKQPIPDHSIFCNWCGYQQITLRDETKVPMPTRKANGQWTAQVMVNGVRIRVYADSEREYYAKARAMKENLIETHKPENRTVRLMVDDYIRVRETMLSPSTIDGYKRKAKHNLQSLYPMRVSDLTTSVVQTAIANDLQKYSGKTVWEAWMLIKSATGVEINNLLLPSKKPKKIPPTYSVEDIRKIMVELEDEGGEIECAGLLAMWLSLRRSEILGLKWEDIGEDYIHVRNARVFDENHQLVEKTTKTEQSERIIPCSATIITKLNSLPKTSEYVFTISSAGLWEGISRVCKLAGVEHGYLHSFRHTNASVMEMIGIPALYANKRGGWVNDHVRLNHYAATMSEGDKIVAKKVDEFFEQGYKAGSERGQND